MKKIFTIILTGLFFCIGVKGQEPQVEGKCVTGNCINGIGTYVYNEGTAIATYKGSFKNGKFNGQGNLEVVGDHKYAGEFKDGLPDGRGTYTFASGELYTGEMKKGVIEGKGFTVFPNGKKFTGFYSNGSVINGKGYLYYPSDSANYTGEIVNGKFSGSGILILVDGEIYTGFFTEGKLNGKGKWTHPAGLQYDGDFKNTKFEGYGVLKDKDGWVYKGNWTNNKRNGKGNLFDDKGNLDYSGEWNDGNMTDLSKSASYKNNLWENAKKIFSRVTFKGWQKVKTDEVSGTVEITDEFYLNSDYTFYGTMAYVINYKGKNYRTKMKTVGTFDPFTNKIHISPRDIIYNDDIEGMGWMRGACDGVVYIDDTHPGYSIIKGKTMSGSDFEEGDYY